MNLLMPLRRKQKDCCHSPSMAKWQTGYFGVTQRKICLGPTTILWIFITDEWPCAIDNSGCVISIMHRPA